VLPSAMKTTVTSNRTSMADELQKDINEKKKRIRSAFDLFDKEKKGCVIQEEVSTIMRYLGAYPSEKDIIKRILPEMQEDEPTAFVTYEKFEKKMLDVMIQKEYKPDIDDRLRQAFLAIDKQRKGWIDEATMTKYLTTKGTPFRSKEVESFMSVAKDPDTRRIYYDDYIALMMKDLEEMEGDSA
jgi:Ca2+-binding EF-hand superfamily protein